MKLLFGVKLGRLWSHSTIWIAASHRRECGVSVLAVNEYSQASGAKSVEGVCGAISARVLTLRELSDWSAKTSSFAKLVAILSARAFAAIASKDRPIANFRRLAASRHRCISPTAFADRKTARPPPLCMVRGQIGTPVRIPGVIASLCTCGGGECDGRSALEGANPVVLWRAKGSHRSCTSVHWDYNRSSLAARLLWPR